MDKEKKKTMKASNLSGIKIREVVILGIILIGLVVLVVKYQGGRVTTIVDRRQLKQYQEKVELCNKTIELSFESKAEWLTLTASFLPDKGNPLSQSNCEVLQSMLANDRWKDCFIADVSGSCITAGRESKTMKIAPYYREIVWQGQTIVSDFMDYDEDGSKELLVMVPITDDKGVVSGVLCGVIDLEFYKNEMKKLAEGGIHYYLTDMNGNVFGEYCLSQKEEKVTNLFEYMKSYGKDSNSITKLQNEMDKGKTGIVILEVKGTKNCFGYTPVSDTGMYLFMAFNEPEIYNTGKIVKKSYHSLLVNIMAVFVVFVSAVIRLYTLGNRRAEKHADELKQLAEIDALTSVYNKAATVKYIKQHLETLSSNEYCALFIIDVDNFKMINDTKGHAYGDLVLKELGNGIRSEFRVTDIIGRIGGDEFVVFLKHVENNERFMRMQGEKIVEFFQNLRPGEYVKTKVSASIGGAVFPTDATDYENLYKAADKALYLAKKRGKDQYALYEETKQE